MPVPSEVLFRKLTVALRTLPGGVLVGEQIRKRWGKSGKIIKVTDFDGDLTMHLNLGEHMQSQIFWHGSYSRDILYLLRRLLKPGMTFVDGGANVGEIALVAAKLVGPSGRIIAFEPMDRFADQFQSNVAANGLQNVELNRLGLAESRGTAPIFLAESRYADGTRHDGLGTLYKSDVRSHEAATITLVSLDGFLADVGVAPVDLIKLDIEGGELPALKGARNLLEKQRPGIIIEIGRDTCRSAGYEMQDIFAYLSALGYAFYRIRRKGALDPIHAADLGRFQNVYCASA